MENTLTFTTREEYVAWRAEWRANYKLTSQRIRTARNNIKNMQREGKWQGIWTQYSELGRAQHEARVLLDLRADSKVEAGKQRAARIEAVCA